MKITLLLAEAAQAINGKLYILGGGWSLMSPEPSPMAIAVRIEIPWDEANKRHRLRFELVDEDGRAVMGMTPDGERAVEITAEFEVGRPAGLRPGTPLGVALAFTIGALPLKTETRYVWRCTIDGIASEDWQVGFATRFKGPAGRQGPAIERG